MLLNHCICVHLAATLHPLDTSSSRTDVVDRLARQTVPSDSTVCSAFLRVRVHHLFVTSALEPGNDKALV